MRIAVVGAGAMGATLGAYLTRSGLSPLIVDASPEHVAAIRRDGIAISGRVDMTVPAEAVRPDEVAGEFDLAFLLVKQTRSREALASFLPHLKPDGVICTLQNGIPEPLVASLAGRERTVGGSCLWGATFVRPGEARLTNDLSARTHCFEIGELDGTMTGRIKAVAGVLEKMGPTKITDNLAGARWYKLMLNASMSGMSAALGYTFGQVVDDDKALSSLCFLAREVVRVSVAAGVAMNQTNNLDLKVVAGFADAAGLAAAKERFRRHFLPLYPAKASMLQDLEAGRPTEVDMINGHVCDEGRRVGVATPVNDAVRDIITRIGNKELPLSRSNLDLIRLPEN